MNDLTTLTGSGRTVRIGDEELTLCPFSCEEWAALQQWVDTCFPDPHDTANEQIARGRLVVRDGKAAREPYTIQQQQFMLRTAAELAAKGRRLLGSPEADEKVQSTEGIKHLLYLSARKGNPAFTEADAERVFGKMTLVDIGRLYGETTAEQVIGDPKAGPGAGATPTPETTTPAGSASP